jgi:hypothetical protein
MARKGAISSDGPKRNEQRIESSSQAFNGEYQVRCVQSADYQPPATDLWLNRCEPEDHRVAVDRPPSLVLSRWYSRWVLKLRVPSSSHRCARLVLLCGRYIHLPRVFHRLSAGLSLTSMGFHARDARWHARAGLPPARCEPGLCGQRSQACAERSLPCSVVFSGALELAVESRLPRDAVISIDRLIYRSATAPLGLTPSVCWIQSCVPVTDIVGHRMSSFSCRFRVEAAEQMVRRETTQFPNPRVRR